MFTYFQTEMRTKKLIGVYATEKDADAARDRVKNAPGFIDKPEGFFEIGKDHWTEGYVTV